ncbi:MAG: outer membrane beta-barrel protein [Ferruginibacter sp.]
MKSVYILVFLICTGLTVAAQNTQLNISLNNTNKLDSVDATATLYQLPDSVRITTKALNDSVSFNVPVNKTYLLQLSAVGKKTVLKNIQVKNLPLNVNISMVNNASDLEGVVVVAKRSFIKQEDDKTIVDAEPLSTTSSNAYEVLEKTPGAVLIDGNVYLNSSTPAVIQINGREVKMSAEEVSALLKNLPANSVVKIEILRTPSAKYDASSSGGIINIVLKKGVKLGTSGSVNAEYSQGRYTNGGAGFSLSNNNGKLKTNLAYSFYHRKNFEDLSSRRFFKDTILAQHAYTRYPSFSHFLNAGFDYEVNKKLSVSYGARVTAGRNNNNSNNIIELLAAGQPAALATSNALTSNRNNNFNFNNDLDINFKLDSLGSEWTNELSFNINRGKSRQHYDNILIQPLNSSIAGDGLTNARRYYFAWESDLVKKIKTLTLEAGTKFSSNKLNNEAGFTLTKGSLTSYDSSKSARFKYREEIASVYLQLSKKIGGLSIKPGIRMEHTNMRGNELTYDTGFSIKRTDFFPYVYLRHKLFNLFGMDISANGIFRKSISRPGYGALNPTPVYVDQFVYNIGNPALQPQFTTNYEFNITADEYPVFSIGKNEIRDIFTSVTYEDTATKIIYNTHDNLGKNDEFYIRAVAGIPPGKKYFFYTGAQHNLNRYQGTYQKRPFDYTNGSWLFFMFHSYKVSTNTTLSTFGFYRLRSLFNFYELQPFGMVNFSVNQSVMKKKANIILSANDIFRTMRFDFKLQQASINAAGSRFNDSRRLTLKFIYNFGIKPKQEGKMNFDVPGESN